MNENTTPRRRSLVEFLQDAGRALTWFVGLLVGGTLFTLLASQVVGYLPYSDRPGPGWSSPPPTFRDVVFFGSWSLLLLPTALLWGLLLFLFARLLGWLRSPRWLVATVGALLSGYASLILIAGFGWYIAIAAFPVYAAGVFGAAFGGLVLPRFARLKRGESTPRWAGILTTLAIAALIVYRLVFVHPYIQQLDVQFVRTGAERPNQAATDLTPDEERLLRSVSPGTELHFGPQTYIGGDPAAPKARMLIVCRGPVDRWVSLRRPRATNVVYVQTGNTWSMYPTDAPTVSEKIEFGPADKLGSAVLLRISPGESRFTWYPPISGRQ